MALSRKTSLADFPGVGEARQKKVDEAIKILQLMRLLPLLKESGLFSGLAAGLL